MAIINKILWIFADVPFCRQNFSLSLEKHPSSKCMSNFMRNFKLFSKVLMPFSMCISNMKFLGVLQACHHLVLSVFLMLAILMGIHWHLLVVLLCISLTTNDAELVVILLYASVGGILCSVFIKTPHCCHCFLLCHLSHCWVVGVYIFWNCVLSCSTWKIIMPKYFLALWT